MNEDYDTAERSELMRHNSCTTLAGSYSVAAVTFKSRSYSCSSYILDSLSSWYLNSSATTEPRQTLNSAVSSGAYVSTTGSRPCLNCLEIRRGQQYSHELIVFLLKKKFSSANRVFCRWVASCSSAARAVLTPEVIYRAHP